MLLISKVPLKWGGIIGGQGNIFHRNTQPAGRNISFNVQMLSFGKMKDVFKHRNGVLLKLDLRANGLLDC
jgi:hypothetical protein